MRTETINLRHGAKLLIEIAETDDGGQAVRCFVRFSDESSSQPLRVRLDAHGMPEEWGGRQGEDDQALRPDE